MNNTSSQESSSVLIWDYETLLNRVRGKPERVVKLTSLFLQEMPKTIEQLNDAVRDLKFEEMQNQAHGIKGGSGNIAANKLYRAAAQIEDLAKNQTTSTPKELEDAASHLSSCFSEFEDHVKERIK